MPITFDRFIRGLLVVLFIAAAFGLIHYLSSVLLPFFIAWGVAYFLYPMVLFFQRTCRLRNRVLSIIVSLLVVTLVVSGIVALIVPPMVEQTVRLKQLITTYLTSVGQNKSVPTLIEEWIKPYLVSYDWAEQLQNGNLIGIVKAIAPKVGGLLAQTVQVLDGLVTFFLVLLYLFFILLDYETLTRSWQRLLPLSSRRQMRDVAGRVRANMGSYFRGQSLVALLVGILFAIGFSIIDFPMAIALGMFIGVLNLVPYLQLVGLVPTVILSLLKAYDTDGSFWFILLSALAVFAVVQVLQDMVLTPRIMGKALGLNPAVMLLSLSVWGYVLGFIGLILALPLTNLILVYIEQWISQRDADQHDDL